MDQFMCKQSFSDAYESSTADSYFASLRPLLYRNYDFVWEWFHRSENWHLLSPTDNLTILDLGCSYGINSLAFRLSLPFRASDALLSDPEGIAWVKKTLQERQTKLRIIGADTSSNALAFAKSAHLIDSSICTDMNTSHPNSQERAVLSQGVNLIVASGVFSYINPVGFDRLLSATKMTDNFMIVGWPLYGQPMQEYFSIFEAYGLHTERSGNLVPQRLYASDEERFSYWRQAEANNVPVSGTLAERYLCATEFTSTRDL